MELNGKIISVLEERSGIAKASGKPYRVAQYVIETIEQYPKKMVFEVFGDDKINQMNIQAGEELTVSFDVDAREYNGRWYNQIRAWKVEREENKVKEATDSADPLSPFPPIADDQPTDDQIFPF